MTMGMDQRWRRRVVSRLRIGPDDTVLDLACGTGDFAILAADRGSRVVGVDFAGGMLRAGRERYRVPVDLVQGDALRLPLQDGSIDAVLCGFALRNFDAIPPVLAELARVVRPGGRIGFLEVDRPSAPGIRTMHGLYFNRVVPVVGGWLSDRHAYRYLPESVTYLPPAADLEAMFHAAGFPRFKKESLMFGAVQALYGRRAR